MNRTIKEATVKTLPLQHTRAAKIAPRKLRRRLYYNFARRLKTLNGLTPYEFIAKAWTKEPKTLGLDPIHQMPGLNTSDYMFA